MILVLLFAAKPSEQYNLFNRVDNWEDVFIIKTEKKKKKNYMPIYTHRFYMSFFVPTYVPILRVKLCQNMLQLMQEGQG